METIQYIRAALRSWWVIVLAVIAGGAGGYVVYARETPMYHSSVRLVVAVTTPGIDEIAKKGTYIIT